MYLKTLEIRGFKSFADHTELNFDSGINVIVGPNGCGKSNIVDAVRWVLGEANVRSLRGYKNEDVIFNGTDKKRGLGMAQVDLTMDNSEGFLPLAYNEITISRKIFRSGESEFSLNKARVRMKDIVKLYTDTGLGKKGYSIISQGELERVLNGQPFERRLMLEEAAGTMHYRQQKEEVQQRILATAQDLLRVEDILNELRSRKSDLYRKAEKARVYISLKDEFNRLDRQVMTCQIQQLADKLAAEGVELETSKMEYERLCSRQDGLIQERNSMVERQEQHRTRLSQSKERKYELETGINKLSSEVKLLQERIRNHRERTQSAQQDFMKYGSMLERLDQDLQQKSADFEREQVSFEQRQSELESLHQEIAELESNINGQEKALVEQSRQVFDRANRESSLKNEILDLEGKIKKALEKRERSLIRLEEKEHYLIASIGKSEALQAQKDKVIAAQQRLTRNINEVEGDLRSYQKKLAEMETDGKNISRERMVLERKISVWEELHHSHAGYSEGVKSLLSAYERGEIDLPGLKGLVTDLFDVPAGMELAMYTALGAAAENIVVETGNTARLAIEVLKNKRWGRVTFLPLDNLRSTEIPQHIRKAIKREEGVVGIAAELVQYEPENASAIDYLLGRTLLVDNMTSGLRIFNKYTYPLRIVTMEGETINTSGAITGGIRSQAKPNMIQRRQEGKSLRGQLETILQSEEQNRTKTLEQAALVKQAEIRLAELKKVQAEHDFQVQITEEEEQRLKGLIEKATMERDIHQQETAQLEQFILENEALMKDTRKTYQEHQTQNSLIDDQSDQLKMEMELSRRDYEVKRERFSSYQEQLSMKKRELESNAKNIAQLEQVRTSYQQSAQEAQELEVRLQTEVVALMERIEITAEKIKGQQQELNRVIVILEGNRRDEMQLLQSLESMDEEVTRGSKKVEDLQDYMRTLEIRVVRLQTELEGIQAQWQDKYPGEEIDPEKNSLSPRQVREYRKRVEDLRYEIEALGAVDIDSVKEYDDLKVRYDFLNQQTDDLIAAKTSLENLLNETEKIMSANFNEFMKLADESFKKTFREIFNGGDAHLEIAAAHDLSAGVEIVVKMPGKRSQSLNLLSGGERALTCIAFIFALLRIKPAPFCLLDEIDASLDEANLQRFADFLKSMSKDTQFIVITHRPATIEAGSSIYGITMPQEGISSVLSIQYQEAQSLAG